MENLLPATRVKGIQRVLHILRVGQISLCESVGLWTTPESPFLEANFGLGVVEGGIEIHI